MAKQQAHLTITVGADGTAQMDFHHFHGTACLDASRQLHALLADFGVESQRTSFVPKPELALAPASQVVSQSEYLREGGNSR